MANTVLDLGVIARTPLSEAPYPHLIGESLIKPEAIADITATFPQITTTGFHPVDDFPQEGGFKALVEAAKGPELSAALSEKFGIDFVSLPRLVTLRKLSAKHEGRIHVDGEKKVMSLLIYLNDGWSSPEGRLRVLRGEHDMEDYTAEIDPKMGAWFAFLRRDNSWHGHPPFVGERRVLQIAWLRSEADLARKKGTHKVSEFFKKLLGQSEAA